MLCHGKDSHLPIARITLVTRAGWEGGVRAYLFLKGIHILGVILLLGNIIVTAWWKIMADRTRDPRVIAFALSSK